MRVTRPRFRMRIISWAPRLRRLKRAGFLQLRLHPSPALPAGFLWCACAAPVRFQTDGEAVTVALERGKLSCPIDNAAAHGGPRVAFSVRFFCNVFAVAMSDTLFG